MFTTKWRGNVYILYSKCLGKVGIVYLLTFRFYGLNYLLKKKTNVTVLLIIYDFWIGVKRHVFIPDFHYFGFIQVKELLNNSFTV